MKKIYYFIFVLIIILSMNNYAHASSYHEYVKFNGDRIEITTTEGDRYVLETDDNLNYRIKKNSEIYLDITDLSKHKLFFMKMSETQSYIYLYGSYLTNNDNDKNTTAYIVRIDKEMIDYDLYISECNEKYNHFNSMVEYSSDMIVATLFYNGEFNFYYTGMYKLITFDRNLNKISSLDIGESEAEVSIYFNLIEVKDAFNRKTYFDREFNKVNPSLNEIIYGSFELDKDMIVNSKEYEIGTVFNVPGIYILKDENNIEKKITLKANVEFKGTKNDNGYIGKVSYKISGGTLYLNSEKVYLNGEINSPGDYTFIIVGINDYMETYSIRINSTLKTEIKDVMEIGDLIEFSGTAYLNNNEIYSGYKINDVGEYLLSIYLDGDVVETYSFKVENKEDKTIEKTKEDNKNNNNNSDDITIKILYGILGILGVILVYSITKTIIKRIKEKKITSSDE